MLRSEEDRSRRGHGAHGLPRVPGLLLILVDALQRRQDLAQAEGSARQDQDQRQSRLDPAAQGRRSGQRLSQEPGDPEHQRREDGEIEAGVGDVVGRPVVGDVEEEVRQRPGPEHEAQAPLAPGEEQQADEADGKEERQAERAELVQGRPPVLDEIAGRKGGALVSRPVAGEPVEHAKVEADLDADRQQPPRRQRGHAGERAADVPSASELEQRGQGHREQGQRLGVAGDRREAEQEPGERRVTVPPRAPPPEEQEHPPGGEEDGGRVAVRVVGLGEQHGTRRHGDHPEEAAEGAHDVADQHEDPEEAQGHQEGIDQERRSPAEELVGRGHQERLAERVLGVELPLRRADPHHSHQGVGVGRRVTRRAGLGEELAGDQVGVLVDVRIGRHPEVMGAEEEERRDGERQDQEAAANAGRFLDRAWDDGRSRFHDRDAPSGGAILCQKERRALASPGRPRCKKDDALGSKTAPGEERRSLKTPGRRPSKKDGHRGS